MAQGVPGGQGAHNVVVKLEKRCRLIKKRLDWETGSRMPRREPRRPGLGEPAEIPDSG